MIHLVHDVLLLGVGYVAMSFTPSIGRTIKGFFTKKSKAVVAATPAAVVSDVKAAASAVEKKV